MSHLQLKGRMAELNQKRVEFGYKAQGLMRGIKALLETSAIDPLENIRANEIESLASQLAEVRREYMENLDMIREIKQELES